MPTVKIPPCCARRRAASPRSPLEGETVGDVLRALAETHPDTREQLFADDGELNRYVNVYLNDEDVRVLDGPRPRRPIGHGRDPPAMAGGAA